MSDQPQDVVNGYLIEKRKASISHRMSRLELVEASIDVLDFTTDHMLLKLEADIWSHRLDKQIQTDKKWVPATWWQHLKLALIKRGIPFIKPENIRMTCLTFTTEYIMYETYPEANFQTPKWMRVMLLDLDATSKMEEVDESRTDHQD